MKKNCIHGRLVKNEKTGTSDSTYVHLEGAIVDNAGEKVPYVFSNLTDQNTKNLYVSIADSTGRLRLSGITSGTYTLKVHAFGYQDLTITDLVLRPAEIHNIIVDIGEYCCIKVDVKLIDHDKPKKNRKNKNKK